MGDYRKKVNFLLRKLEKEARDLFPGLQEYDYSDPDAIPPSALLLLGHARESIPCVFRGLAKSWPCYNSWRNRGQFLSKLPPDHKVNVSVTPNGLADATWGEDYMVMPHDSIIPTSTFLSLFTPASKTFSEFPAVYLQSQNDNITFDFPNLFDDTPGLEYAHAAFGSKSPEAMNLWIGSDLSTTSLHKDNYENLFACLIGRKKFTLFNPTVFHALEERDYRPAHWVPPENFDRNLSMGIKDLNVHGWKIVEEVSQCSGPPHSHANKSSNEMSDSASPQGENGDTPNANDDENDDEDDNDEDDEMEMDQDEGNSSDLSNEFESNTGKRPITIPWISYRGTIPKVNLEQNRKMNEPTVIPTLRSPKPSSVVTLEPGDVLYLPSGWYHQVEQEAAPWPLKQGDPITDYDPRVCMALNFWYDIPFGLHWTYGTVTRDLSRWIRDLPMDKGM